MTGSNVDGDLAAVATAGTAIVLKDTVNTPVYAGSLFTGGGKVKSPGGSIVDASGNDPLVGACRAAQAGAVSASVRLAGLSPSQSLGDVTIKTGETRFILATEGAVIEIDSLTIGGNEGRYYCLSNGTLDISGGSGVVLNVRKRLSIGSCGQIYNSSNTAVINVPGRGPSVRIGGEAYVEIPILAPGRNAIVTGSNNDDEGATFIIPIWAKGARMTGLSQLDLVDFYSAGCPQQLRRGPERERYTATRTSSASPSSPRRRP